MLRATLFVASQLVLNNFAVAEREVFFVSVGIRSRRTSISAVARHGSVAKGVAHLAMLFAYFGKVGIHY